jgi:predicted HicB family RNase H-like nuclease
VPEHFHRRLKMQAAAEGTTIAELIIGVLTEYLERQGR